ncbi:MAG: Cna B-type domain-containing protein, partial [Lachnospiraceae bacterium]|nr:Cna B-type domain-containing protein [Lachnospiraceae bacterium]
DGIRPTSITINLYANGVLYNSQTVTEGENWSWSFTELDKYAGGKEIEYTITEDVVKGYTSDIKGYNVENTHTPEKTEVSGSKTWNDNDNQDGKRPASITINLLANGKKVASKTVTADDNWSWNFTELDKYANGTEINYTITEEEVDDYTTEVNGYDVKNTHAPGKISVNGSKTWNDNDDQDGKRPSSIKINLYANGTLKESKEVTEADGWSWTFDNLDKYANGKEIKYTVTEDAVTDYTTVVNGYNVINTHNPEKTSVSGSKTWTDADNQDGIRPTSITINLYANGVLKNSQTVTEGNNWSWSFTELDKYADGEEIEYTITEDAVKGYTAEIDEYDVENTHTPEKTEVSGSKTWNDNNNQDGKRPTSITINLLANGKEVDSKEVTEADGWSWTFDNLDKYAGGQEINYTITEEEVDDYSAEVDGYDVINTHAPGKTSVNGSKTWEDAGNQDGKRPTSIVIRLYADGEEVDSKTVTEADGWSWTFDELDKYANGTEIKYTVTEDVVEDYTTEINGYNVINTHNPEKTSVSGSKTWNDNDDQDGRRPSSIKINLYADGALKDSKEVEPDADGNWTFKFENLDKYADGEVIEYTITEDAVKYYQTQINGTRVFNTHTPEKTKVEGSKTWVPDENGEEAIPESIIIRLWAVGQKEEVAHKTVTAADNWSWTFENLDKFKDGEEIVYTITEDRVADYSTTYSGYDVINTYTPDYTQISIAKVWDDNDNQDGIRPDSIMVQLYAGLFAKGDAVELNEGNNWSYTWSNLPDSRFGFKINYSVKEVDVPDGYEAEVIDGTLTTITNKHVPETVEVSGEKTWDDNDNQDGIRPISIIVNLLADGDVIDSVEVTEADEWKWSFTNLPKNKNVDGEVSEIIYTITEEKVAGYDDAVITGFDIRNPHTPEVIDIEGTKTWDDADNQDGIRPSEITVHLFADGTEVGSQTVTEADGWSWKFEGLDKFKNGVEIVYTLTEDVVEGYSTSVEGFNITNSYTPGVTSRTVNKVWDDAGNRDNLRPVSIRVQLYADGEAYGDEVILSEANGWSYTWEDLAEKKDGKLISYTVTEIETADGYTVSYSDDTFVITNTHTPTPTPTPGNEPTPTPGGGNEPTPTPGDEPGPTPEVNPTPGYTPAPSATPNDEEVLGARRSPNAVLGARRGPKTAVLGKRRRPATGDSFALLIWIMVLSLGAGGTVVSSTMLRYKKRDEK